MSNDDRDHFHVGNFPDNFYWGTATSSYQIEGAWNVDGKGENIWDRFCHSRTNKIRDGSNGDVACDSYNRYLDDVKALKVLGVKLYRFSISWARLMPNGTPEQVNEAGIAYYNQLIDSLLAEGIQPVVTLFHWDLPQNLQEMNGWESHELVSLFGEYARLCYHKFGDRVKLWVTINEPFVMCYQGYDIGIHAPGIEDGAEIPYKCMHVILKAHATAYHIYKEEFQKSQKGRVGIAPDCKWYEPANPKNPEDVAAAERLLQFHMGWVLSPLFTGSYPPIMQEFIDKAGKQGTESRLPKFDAEWGTRVKGSFDFIGLNHYTTSLVKHRPTPETKLGWLHDACVVKSADPSWPTAGSPWLQVVPWGLRKLLVWIKTQYGNPEIIITENGASDNGGVKDTVRQDYFRRYINEVLKAVTLDGCNVTGYIAWSLMDNFEWDCGYTEKFGIFAVDPKTLERVPKESAKLLAEIIKNNGFPQ